MKKLFKRGIALICMFAMLLSVLPAVSAAEGDTEFVILSTTDMHGRCWDKNVLTDTNTDNSMLNVATAVAGVREQYDNVILLDNGDTYQGTPVSAYQLSQQQLGLTELPNPMALSMKEIGYDAATIGNHEFNYAWDLMQDVRAYLGDAAQGNAVASLCANLYYDGTDGVHTKGENVFTPYMFKEITLGAKTYKIAIIGFENTDCPRWDVPDNYPGIVFSHPDNATGSMAWEAEKYVAEVKAQGADFVVVAYHSGLGDGAAPEDIQFGVNSEGQILSMLKYNTGIDLVIAGHDHNGSYSGKTYPDAEGNQVMVVNGAGNNLTKTVVAVNEEGKLYIKSNDNLVLKNYAADTSLKAKIQPYVDLCSAYVNQECGTILPGDWSTSTKFYLEQTDTMDIVGRAQMAMGSKYLAQKYASEDDIAALYAETGLDHLTVDMSSTSMGVNDSYTVQPGKMTMKSIYQLYKYDNTLYLLPLTGQEIKDIMEFNAEHRLAVNTASGTPVFTCIGENFTNPVFYGLDFKYDMAQEPGSRVIIDGFTNGKAFELDKTYIFAVNNYHLGNGPFAEYSTDDAIWSQVDDLGGGFVQDLIAEFLAAETEKNGGVSPAPSDWKIVYTGDITVGEASGRFIGDLVEDTSALASGDQVMIFHVAGTQLLSNISSGSKLSPCMELTIGEKKVGTNNETVLFTVVKGDDGYYRFVDADGKYLTSGETGNSLSMTDAENPYSLWEFEATDGGFYVHNVNAAYNGNTNQYLEFYSGGFTTYGLNGGGAAYLMQIYKLSAVSDCQHEKAELSGKTDPTCDKAGFTGSLVCSDCGEVLELGENIPALGHDYSKTEKVEPTCTTMGYTKNLCSRCDSFYRNEFVSALGHDYEDGVCKVCDEKEPSDTPDVPVEPENPSVLDKYEDLARGQWYSAAATYVLENGLMIGVSETEFDPDGELTRAMFVTILYRAAGEPDVSYVKNPYNDVEKDTWYTDSVLWASSNGIVNGVGYGQFAPDENITREQMVTILWRYANKPEANKGVLNAYYDSYRISSYAKTAMAWAVEEGILNGEYGKLLPTDNATRIQTAAIFYRYLMD